MGEPVSLGERPPAGPGASGGMRVEIFDPPLCCPSGVCGPTTDPASNLADVFEQEIGHKITPITGVPNLWAMEIDPDKATDEYKDRALAPIRELFPPEIVNVMAEQMNSPCTAEVAAFDRFTDFLDAPNFDVVIFDTAPTGHTLRLLELPAEWSHMIETASSANAQTCMGPVAAIQDAKAKYDRALVAMRDAAQTTFLFVLQPEATPIKETHRATGELAKLGIHNSSLMHGTPDRRTARSISQQRP